MQQQTMVNAAPPPLSQVARRRRGAARRFARHVGVPYLFLSPYLVLFALFFVVPLVYAFHLSLYVTRLVGGTVFVGADNYKQVFQDGNFLDGVKRMVIFGIFQVPIM